MTPDVLDTYWRRLVEIADKYNEPGKFTTFAAYEWTSTPNTANLHRNIFFLDSKKVPDTPFSAAHSDDPRELWKWMDSQRKAGNELLAIPHNSNLSNGLMFTTEEDDRGRPIDKAWAEARMRNEPLVELKQAKGLFLARWATASRATARRWRVSSIPTATRSSNTSTRA